MRICSIENCGKKYSARGLCMAHYVAMRRHGDLIEHIKNPRKTYIVPSKPLRLCTVENCGKKHYARGFCIKHWNRLKKHGDVYAHLVNMGTSHPTRLCTVDACTDVHWAKGLCMRHYNRLQKYGRLHLIRIGRFLTHEGYVMILDHDHPNARKNGHVMEHIAVMSHLLGRPLTKKEEVHHKNGVRDDNRLENLELWDHSQPPGQRTSDKIAFYLDYLKNHVHDAPLWPDKNTHQAYLSLCKETA